MKNFLSRLRRLWPYFAGTGTAVALMLLCVALLAMTEPLVPALFKLLLDRGFGASKLALWTAPVAILGLFALRGVGSFLADYLLTHVSFVAMKRLRQDLFDKLLRVQLPLFQTHSASMLANIVVYDVQAGMQNLVGLAGNLLRNVLTLVALLAYLLYLNWQLTSVVLLILPPIVYAMRALSRRVAHIVKTTQAATDELAYVVEENVLARRETRLFQAQAQQRQRFEGYSARLRALALKSTAASAAMTPISQLLAASALSVVVCVALWQAQQGAALATVGGFVAFVMAMLQLIAPIKHLSESIGPLTRGLVALERGVALIAQHTDEPSGSHAVPRARGDIHFEDVQVRYEGQDKAALAGLTLTVHSGEIVAIVGSSGSGKSTLIQLLPRFLIPTRGDVLLDGVSLSQWNLEVLRHQIALVSQHVAMFNDTLAANITLGDSKPDLKKLERAVDAAHLRAFVNDLPKGLETLCGHNAGALSGGQRQRLAIARAVYKDAPVLLLDEATSALDNESERAVQAALHDLMQGRTTLIVAHRLSTIAHADRIVVLHEGQIAEMGTHAALLARNAHYAKLYRLGQNGML